MTPRTSLILLLAGLAVAGCSASPDAPVNQAAPIRLMDNFFRSLPPHPAPPAAEEGPEHEPGYAPAYPPYGP
jgi:hypothetical protein